MWYNHYRGDRLDLITEYSLKFIKMLVLEGVSPSEVDEDQA